LQNAGTLISGVQTEMKVMLRNLTNQMATSKHQYVLFWLFIYSFNVKCATYFTKVLQMSAACST